MEKIIGDPCLDMAEFYFRSKRGSQAKTDTLIELTFWNDIILLCSNGTSEQLAETQRLTRTFIVQWSKAQMLIILPLNGSPNQDSAQAERAILRKSRIQRLNRLTQVGRYFVLGWRTSSGQTYVGNQPS